MRNRWLGFVVVALALIASVVAYPHLPERIVTHWNARGQADGYSSRAFGAFVTPAGILVMAVVVQVLPVIDPRRANYAKFSDTYWLLVNGILVFMGLVHLALLGSGAGLPVPIQPLVRVGIGVLFVVLGNHLGRVQPNWFLGIRTPWTLSSDVVWRKTHRLAAWTFVGGGLVFAASAFVPLARSYALLGTTIAIAVLAPVVYSLYLWKREQTS